MKFIDLHADGFGKMVNKDVSFEDKINVIYGHNEAGKSTMHAYIRAMLFGIKRAKGVAAQTDIWSHYKPWKSQKYGGTLRIEDGGHIYKLTRDFYEAPMDVSVYDETAGVEVENPDEWLSGVLCNMTIKSYDNTISIGQLKSSTDASMAEEIKASLVNANTTGNSALNCEKAKEFLNAQKADLAAQLSAEATRKFALNSSEIKKIENEIKDPSVAAEASEFEKELESLELETQNNSREMSNLNDAITSEKQELIDNKFNSSADVSKSKEKFQQVCNDYYEAKRNCKASKAKVIRIVFLVFTILCGLGTIAAIVFKNNNAITQAYGLDLRYLLQASVIAGIIFMILTIFFSFRNNKEKKKLKASAVVLASELRHYGVKDDFSTESINQVNEYLDHLNTVAISVEEKETELDRIRDRQEQIVTKKNETLDSIEERKQAAGTVGEKVMRLRELHLENEGLQEQIAANERITSNMDAIDMALTTIDEISKDYQNSIGRYLNGEVSKYIAEITNGAYNSVSIDDNLDVFLNTEDRVVPLESVSSGTSDQIYLALRLASARIFQNNEYKLPLIFDDSLVNYDAKRLEASLKWISDTYKNQVIIFSCHKREASILEDLGIDFNKIEL